MTAPAQARPWQAALSLFTVIPVGADPALTGEAVARAVQRLPLVGLLVGAPAAAVLLAAEAGGHGAARRALASVLAVAALAALTGGLHLDGLADTADGLGSRRPREQALAIMRRPDIGAFGVAALVFVVLIQVAALAAAPPGLGAAAGLVLAAVTGRAGVVLASGPAFPPARGDGLGALAACAASAPARALTAAALLAAAGGAGAALGGAAQAAREVAAAAAGLLAAALVSRAARRVLGGLTGDVYGAVVEVSAATVLVVLALA